MDHYWPSESKSAAARGTQGNNRSSTERLRMKAQLPQSVIDAMPAVVAGLQDVQGAEGLRLVSDHFLSIAAAELETSISLLTPDPFARDTVIVLSALLTSRKDPAAAWATYTAERERIRREEEELEPQIRSIMTAAESDDWTYLRENLEPSLTRGRRAGLIYETAVLSFTKGDFYWRRPDGQHASNIETSLAAFLEGFGLSSMIPRPDLAIESAHRLAVAYGERMLGDHLEDLPKSELLLREILKTLPPDEQSLLAMCHTNLAVLLLRTSDGDNIEARLEEAREHCQEALRFRRITRNANDWTYSQLTLGDIQRVTAIHRDESCSPALRSYKKVLQNRHRISDSSLVAASYHRLSRLELQMLEYANAVGNPSSPKNVARGIDTTNLLSQALSNLQGAVEYSSRDSHLNATILIDLSRAKRMAGQISEAIAAGESALTYLRPAVDPENCRVIAGHLGDIYASLGRWHECANAFLLGVEAAELMFHSRVNFATRLAEIRSAGNIYRWTAYVLARDNQLSRAVEILELGRARELRDREPLSMEELLQLKSAPQELQDRFNEAVSDLSAAPFGEASRQAIRAYHLALVEIRQEIGLANSGFEGDLNRIASAASEGWPLVYVDPTPWGTVLFSVTRAQGVPKVKFAFLDVTSLHIYLRIMLGPFDPSGPTANVPPLSYLLNASQGGDDLEDAIELLLPWLGESVVRHIASLEDVRRCIGATLILCGPIGAAPLHAATWNSEGAERTLIDSVSIRYCPSALALGSCIRRAESYESDLRLLALGNPESKDPRKALPGAEREVEAIAELVGLARCSSCR